jgi:hypothetical protein
MSHVLGSNQRRQLCALWHAFATGPCCSHPHHTHCMQTLSAARGYCRPEMTSRSPRSLTAVLLPALLQSLALLQCCPAFLLPSPSNAVPMPEAAHPTPHAGLPLPACTHAHIQGDTLWPARMLAGQRQRWRVTPHHAPIWVPYGQRLHPTLPNVLLGAVPQPCGVPTSNIAMFS